MRVPVERVGVGDDHAGVSVVVEEAAHRDAAVVLPGDAQQALRRGQCRRSVNRLHVNSAQLSGSHQNELSHTHCVHN